MKQILNKFIQLTLLVLLFAGCTKQIAVPTNSADECLFDCDDLSKLEVVWTKSINGENQNTSNLQAVLYNSSIIFGAMAEDDLMESIYSFDVNTGDLKWKWNDYFPFHYSYSPIKKLNIYTNLGILSTQDKDYVLNLDQGTTLWKYSVPAGSSSSATGSVIDNFIYHPQDIEGSNNDSVAYMVRTHLTNPNWENVFSLEKDLSGFYVNFEAPTLAIAANGDSLLIFQRRSFNSVNNNTRQDLFAFNLKTNSLAWHLDDIAGPRISSVHPILVKGNIAVFFGHYTVYGIDISTGAIIWSYTGENPEMNGLLEHSSSIIEGDKVYVKTEGNLIYCLYLNSGIRVWSKTYNGTGSNSNIIYHKGKIYFTSFEKIYCIDASNGSLVFKYRSPNATRTDQTGVFKGTGGLAIDPLTNRMYFADSYYITCVKLPE